MRFALAFAAVAATFSVAAVAEKPVDIPCVTWEPLSYYQNTPDPSSLFLAAYTWVTQYGPEQCAQQGDIFPCFAADVNTWGHHDYLEGVIPNDYCRTYVNGQVHKANQMYIPRKGPQWHTWVWQIAQSGGKVPLNAIRFGKSVMARSTRNAPGHCSGKGFTGWAVGEPNGTFGPVYFTIADAAVQTDTFEVAVCKAYHPTPQPPTPAPVTPAPTTTPAPALPSNKPYIRFGNAIPYPGTVTVTIAQRNVSKTWTNYAFSQFSDWFELFSDGVGRITVKDAKSGTTYLTKEIPLTPGPLVVVTKGTWPPTNPLTSVETIAASFVPPVGAESGLRLFNLAPDVEMAGLRAGENILVDHVRYTIGSYWAPVPVKSQTFTAFNDKTRAHLAVATTTPPNPPEVFTMFLLGMANATKGSAFAAKLLPLIDAPIV